MKIFKHANLSEKDTCLVCQLPEDKPVVLVGIVGTEERNNMQAKQVHVDCLNLLFYPKMGVIGQKLEDVKIDEIEPGTQDYDESRD